MTDEDELQNRFRELANAVPQKASPVVEERLRVEFRTRLNHRRRFTDRVAQAAAVAGVAAGLYLVWSDLASRRGTDQQTTEISRERQRSDFVALPYAQSEVPLEGPVIVRVQIPVSELSAMGLAFAPATAQERVDAELLVGQDGVARAVRLAQ